MRCGRIRQVSQGVAYRHRFVPNVSPRGGSYVCDGSVTMMWMRWQPT